MYTRVNSSGRVAIAASAAEFACVSIGDCSRAHKRVAVVISKPVNSVVLLDGG